MHLAEIEIRKVAGRTSGCTRSATYARLQLRHLEYDLVALAQVVTVDINRAGLIYRKSEIYHLYSRLNQFAMLCATVVASLRVSPTLFGEEIVPA